MWLVLGLLFLALIAFARQWVDPELVSLSILGLLLLTGLVDSEQAVAGFGHPAVVTVVSMFVLGTGLIKTGVAHTLGQAMSRLAGRTETGLIIVTMVTVGLMSAFMNNIAACAILLPVVMNMAREAQVAPTRLLIPLSFGSLLGGLTTLIGTPPNMIVSTALPQHGFEAFRMFDFLPTGLAVLAIGVAFMVLVGRHLLPKREPEEDLFEKYRVREYLTEITILPDSDLVNVPLAESGLGAELGLQVVGIVRNRRTVLSPRPSFVLHAGDVLIVESSVEDLMKVRRTPGLEIHPEAELSAEDLQSPDTLLVEALVAPRSRLAGRTPKQVAFRHRYGVTILAVRRQGRTLRSRLNQIQFRFGDTLLLQGRKERFDEIGKGSDLIILGALPFEERRGSKAALAVAIMAATVGVSAMGWMPVAGVAPIGALLMVLTGCLRVQEAYDAIEWRIVFLIGGMLPLGTAMETTGTAAFIAERITTGLGAFGPHAVMLGIMVVTAAITQVVSNAATAVLMAPLAISAALNMGIAPHAFAMAVAVGASTAFVTPIGHQSNVLVYGAGDYQFLDFTRVGLPLTVLIAVVMTFLIPLFWPF